MFILNRLIINRLIDQILMLQVAINFSGYADTWIRSQFYIIKRSKMVSGNSHEFKSCSHKFSSLRADLRLIVLPAGYNFSGYADTQSEIVKRSIMVGRNCNKYLRFQVKFRQCQINIIVINANY